MKAQMTGLAIAILAATCLHAQGLTGDLARVLAMHDNLRLVTTMQSAVVRGDLAAVIQPARALSRAAWQTGLPDHLARHAAVITDAAAAASVATNVAAAASATGRVMGACGSCHRAAGTMPAMSSPRWPSVGGVVGHMIEHQRAIDQLLRGLAVPSQSEWMAGARALRQAPLHARELPRSARLGPEMLRVEEAVHRLAEEAVGAETIDARVRVYGTLLARCADCHALHRGIWGPGTR